LGVAVEGAEPAEVVFEVRGGDPVGANHAGLPATMIGAAVLDLPGAAATPAARNNPLSTASLLPDWICSRPPSLAMTRWRGTPRASRKASMSLTYLRGLEVLIFTNMS
jgi:hypothetical protein